MADTLEVFKNESLPNQNGEVSTTIASTAAGETIIVKNLKIKVSEVDYSAERKDQYLAETYLDKTAKLLVGTEEIASFNLNFYKEDIIVGEDIILKENSTLTLKTFYGIPAEETQLFSLSSGNIEKFKRPHDYAKLCAPFEKEKDINYPSQIGQFPEIPGLPFPTFIVSKNKFFVMSNEDLFWDASLNQSATNGKLPQVVEFAIGTDGAIQNPTDETEIYSLFAATTSIVRKYDLSEASLTDETFGGFTDVATTGVVNLATMDNFISFRDSTTCYLLMPTAVYSIEMTTGLVTADLETFTTRNHSSLAYPFIGTDTNKKVIVASNVGLLIYNITTNSSVIFKTAAQLAALFGDLEANWQTLLNSFSAVEVEPGVFLWNTTSYFPADIFLIDTNNLEMTQMSNEIGEGSKNNLIPMQGSTFFGIQDVEKTYINSKLKYDVSIYASGVFSN